MSKWHKAVVHQSNVRVHSLFWKPLLFVWIHSQCNALFNKAQTLNWQKKREINHPNKTSWRQSTKHGWLLLKAVLGTSHKSCSYVGAKVVCLASITMKMHSLNCIQRCMCESKKSKDGLAIKKSRADGNVGDCHWKHMFNTGNVLLKHVFTLNGRFDFTSLALYRLNLSGGTCFRESWWQMRRED